MSDLALKEWAGVVPRIWRRRATKVALLSGGIAAGVLYGIGDLVSGLRYDGYSFRDQAISELSAFGSPVRPTMATVIVVHGVLVSLFGLGMLRIAGRMSVRWIGALLIGIGLIGFPTHTVYAMSSRWIEGGFNDTMHIALSIVFSLFVVAAMGLSAVAYKGAFRKFTLATILAIIAFGAGAGVASAGMAEDSTAWLGAFERVNAYATFAWMATTALVAIRTLRGTSVRSSPGVEGPRPQGRSPERPATVGWNATR